MNSNRIIAIVMLLSVAIPATAIAAGGLDQTNDKVPNPYIEELELTKQHDMTWSNLMKYESDDGAVKTLDAKANLTENNPFDIQPSKIEDPQFNEFPRTDGEASILDASEWTINGQNTSKVSKSDTEIVDGVPAIRLETDGSFTSGDSAYFEYSNWTTQLDADELKRHLQLIANVNTLDSNAEVEVRVVDEGGDYVSAKINSSLSSSDKDVIATATGDGYVYQEQLDSLSVTSVDDGKISNIEKVQVYITGADADITIPAFDLERKSEWVFGTKKVDNDGDDALEEKTINEPSGEFSVASLDSMGSTFDDSVIHDLQFPVDYRAADLDAEDVKSSFSEAEGYPNYKYKANVYYRLSVPAAIDLSHSGLSLRDKVTAPTNRYLSVEWKEGVGDTAFEDISDWNSITSQYDTQGANVSIDDTIQPDTQYAYHAQVLVVGDSEKDAMTSSGGALPITGGGGGGGLLSNPLTWIVGVVGAVVAYFSKAIPIIGR